MIAFAFMGRHLVTFMLFLSLFSFIGCKHEGQSMNESLRLSPSEIVEYRVRAISGDRAAAKKLWHHYEAIEWNFEEAAKWKSICEDNIEEEPRLREE